MALRQFAGALDSPRQLRAVFMNSHPARMVLIHSFHDGPDLSRRNRRVLRDRAQLCLGVHPPMSPWELVMGSIMAVGLTAYLVYAMLRPEKF